MMMADIEALPVRWCSRCTGYRPILDAFKVFAKVEPGAYTEEAIAASKAANGGANGTEAKVEAGKKGGKVAAIPERCHSLQCPISVVL